jgi:antitoxin YefM
VIWLKLYQNLYGGVYMETMTATEARSNFFGLIKKAVAGHKQFRVTSRQGEVIVMSQEDYENLLETLELLSTPGLLKGVRKAKKDIQQGHTYSLDEVFSE